MQKWEYIRIYAPSDEQLNSFGEQGWELVTVDEANIFYFKRPKS